jgi:hypothetical protein
MAKDGSSPEVIGTGLVPDEILNVCSFEVPPPGAGLKTVTCAVPTTAMSDAEITAISLVDEANVVTRSAPFQRTTEVPMKLLPVTVRVNAGLPATISPGDSPEIEGTGFGGGGGGLGLPPPQLAAPTATNSANDTMTHRQNRRTRRPRNRDWGVIYLQFPSLSSGF